MSRARPLLALLSSVSCALAILAAPLSFAQQLRVAVTSAAEGAPFFSAMERGVFS